MLCCGYILTDFPISIRLTSLALWQSKDCPSASKATLMNMDIYFMWIHYERLHNHNKAKHNKTVCIFLGIYHIHDDIMTPHEYLVFNSLHAFIIVSIAWSSCWAKRVVSGNLKRHGRFCSAIVLIFAISFLSKSAPEILWMKLWLMCALYLIHKAIPLGFTFMAPLWKLWYNFDMFSNWIPTLLNYR